MASSVQKTWAGQLASGLTAMGLELGREQQLQLLDYLALLLKWNKAYNLTAVRDPGRMVSRQLLDSLTIAALVQGPRVLDVGTGAGLPGIPLSVALPGLHFTLLDTNGKKTRFVRQVQLELGLSNVEVVQQRVEQFASAEGFNTITTRAYAALPDMLTGSRHLLAADGCWLAMKGLVPGEELAALPDEYISQVIPLQVPGESAQRHAIIIRPRTGTET